MIAGNSAKRTFYGPSPDPPMSLWQDSDRTQQSLGEKALGFNCLNYNGVTEGAREYHYLRDKATLDTQCKDGIRAEIMFPSCWNGKDLDSDNHTTHVADPNEVQNGWCPDTHPVRLPTLFYETIYQTNLFAGIDGQFTFANGDPTGYGYHGDFVCAWDAGVLQAAIDSPDCNMPKQTSGNQEDCPVFKLQPVDDGTKCQMEIPEALQNEKIDMIPQLPGNVQIQVGPAPATMGPIPGQSTQPMSSTASPAPVEPSPGATASPKTTQTPCAAGGLLTTTSQFMSNGVLVNLVIVEEVVTVTVSGEATATSDIHRKRQHKHGHHHGKL
jgi:hypothetical protein